MGVLELVREVLARDLDDLLGERLLTGERLLLEERLLAGRPDPPGFGSMLSDLLVSCVFAFLLGGDDPSSFLSSFGGLELVLFFFSVFSVFLASLIDSARAFLSLEFFQDLLSSSEDRSSASSVEEEEEDSEEDSEEEEEELTSLFFFFFCFLVFSLDFFFLLSFSDLFFFVVPLSDFFFYLHQ